MESKQALRTRMKALRDRVPACERDRAEALASDRLRESGLLAGRKEINLYLSFASEFGTSRIKESLLRNHYRVSVPKTENGEMIALRIGRETVYEKGEYGIEVPRSSETVPPETLEVVLLPGLAFDKRGFRVGYGKGYYDRFLAGTRALRIGLCFDFQRVEEIPAQEFDLAADVVLTEKGLYRSKV